MKRPAKAPVSMKRPAKAEVLMKKTAAATKTIRAKKQTIVGAQDPGGCPAGMKPADPEELQLEVLLMSGNSLGLVKIRRSGSGHDLKLAIKRKLLPGKGQSVQRVLPLSMSHPQISDDQPLAKLGFSNGTQVYAVLDEEEDEESEEFLPESDESENFDDDECNVDFSDDSLDRTQPWVASEDILAPW